MISISQIFEMSDISENQAEPKTMYGVRNLQTVEISRLPISLNRWRVSNPQCVLWTCIAPLQAARQICLLKNGGMRALGVFFWLEDVKQDGFCLVKNNRAMMVMTQAEVPFSVTINNLGPSWRWKVKKPMYLLSKSYKQLWNAPKKKPEPPLIPPLLWMHWKVRFVITIRGRWIPTYFYRGLSLGIRIN